MKSLLFLVIQITRIVSAMMTLARTWRATKTLVLGAALFLAYAATLSVMSPLAWLVLTTAGASILLAVVAIAEGLHCAGVQRVLPRFSLALLSCAPIFVVAQTAVWVRALLAA